MSILWVGGEDFDFQDTVTITSVGDRSGYGRTGLRSNSNSVHARSFAFTGGSVTDCWVSGRGEFWELTTNIRYFGVGDNASGKGWLVGASATNNKFALFKYDGSYTAVASEAGTSLTGAATPYKLDMEIISFGANGTINIYCNGTSIISYANQDLTCSSAISAVDCFLLAGNSAYSMGMSEFIVADEDTRTFNLVTLYPNAAGDLNEWTGAYTDIDETTLSDADIIYINTVDKDFQCNLSATPAGTFAVKAAVINARCARTSDSTPTTVRLGVKTGGTKNVGDAETLTTSWALYTRIMHTNPVTTSVWNTTELDALQLDLQSET